MYFFWGKVRPGKKRGKTLGFPTANIQLHKQIPQGIYVSQGQFKKKKYQALTFIGSAKTFGETEIMAEIYILNFEKNLYGKYLSVRLLKKIRENKKFKNAQKLIAQMNRDKMETEKYFKKNSQFKI